MFLNTVVQLPWIVPRFLLQTDSAPYGDATKAWMLRHIDQVSPLLHDNEDVIDALQAGFIGTWGEWRM
jgi:hypothetical protein